MDANELFPPSEYLKSEDIEAAGGEMVLTIANVGRKEYEAEEGKKDIKGVLAFSDHSKKLTLNVTNTNALVTMYGSKDIDKMWVGKPVTLYVDEHVKYAGKEVKGIRIRLIDPKADAITAFWTEARKRGFTQQDGLDHLKLHNNDFAKALEDLLKENPF
jgi:hypothetical protein